MAGLEFTRPDAGTVGIYVGHYPTRKSAVVSIRRGSVSEVVAYCRSDDDARKLQQALADLLGVDLPTEDT